MYKEQGELQKCADTALRAVELGRENRADYKLIAKAFSRAALACKEMEVSAVVSGRAKRNGWVAAGRWLPAIQPKDGA